ncbi:MAG: hypothetical protein ONB16_05585, partial [candidate division KSB1 bacterium]|nr:hypothetical protein [candidate division KSB1 bacterium]
KQAYLDNFIEFWYRLGYDCVRFEQGFNFQRRQLVAQDVGLDASKQRTWVDLHRGSIVSWEDFEQYRWPTIEEVDFFAVEYIHQHLPEGMGLMTCHAAGIFEHVSQIMSYEGLCLALHDQPELVQAVTDRVGGLLETYYQHLLDLDRVIAIFQGDDLGFRSGTLVAPTDLRKYFLPWHKKLAALVHRRQRPYFLHSCGNLELIMDDLISEVCIDGKHSFEDAIVPVELFYHQYGQRVAVLGGLDINILAKGSAEDVRKRTIELIQSCGIHGRYAIGSGNSIPSYIPPINYLSMVDAALAQ